MIYEPPNMKYKKAKQWYILQDKVYILQNNDISKQWYIMQNKAVNPYGTSAARSATKSRGTWWYNIIYTVLYYTIT